MSRLKTARRAIQITGLAAVASLAMAGTAFAGNVEVFSETAVYTGDASAEALTVTQTSATSVTFDLAAPGVVTETAAECEASNSNTADPENEVTCTVPALNAIEIDMLDGNDSVVVSAAVRVDVSGGNGDDRLDLSAASYNGDALSVLMARSSSFSTNFAEGGDGNDTLIAGPSGAYLLGDAGNDSITGGAGDDLLRGGPGLDALVGGAGDDYLHGGSITDATTRNQTSDGADTLDGGLGSDTASYADRDAPVRVDLKVAGGHGELNEDDKYTSIENVEGGNGADTLIGDRFSNTIIGNDGADLIEGGRGFDELRGGRDADVIGASGDVATDFIDCGRGFSTYNNVSGTDADVARLDYLDQLATTADCETVRRNSAPARAPQLGTGDDDRIVGDGNMDLLIGLDGNDTLLGLAASDELQGGFGNDRVFGGNGNDDLYGGHGNDGVVGGAGNDSMSGGPGRDFMLGGAGVDTITGGEGIDRLDGGTGRDYLIARDDVRDTVVCSRTRMFLQQDVVIADTEDRVVNASFCARIERI